MSKELWGKNDSKFYVRNFKNTVFQLSKLQNSHLRSKRAC